ncbi:MAG: galactose mutarotase [Lachnospiraceae bacterium]|nr:galactose mutarotase [Lachnospiraceae bacterium]
MSITVTDFGLTSKGQAAKLYTITNRNGCQAQFTDYGAIWVNVRVPAADGPLDILQHFDSAAGYETDMDHHGSPIGRVANRIAGAGPAFILNGRTYPLPATNQGYGQDINLHSGPDYYDKRLYQAETDEQDNNIRFSLFSPHMDQGYPGNLKLAVTYRLTDDNMVKISYDAVCDEDTLFNMTNHAYFNLNGQGTIWQHRLWIDSTRYTESVDCVPTGRILPVAGTGFDYTAERPVEHFLDDNWCQEPHHCLEKPRIRCTGDQTGIVLEVHTDLPGFQLYTSPDAPGAWKGSMANAICFESQYYVNAVNIDNPEFEKPILKAGEPFHSQTWYHFIF